MGLENSICICYFPSHFKGNELNTHPLWSGLVEVVEVEPELEIDNKMDRQIREECMAR